MPKKTTPQGARIKTLLAAVLLIASIAYPQTAYIVMTDLAYNEGFGMRTSNGAAGWKGWSILGSTDMPYELGMDDYPDDSSNLKVDRITLDLQDRNEIYPRVYGTTADTGRVIRMQIQDGGTAFDLTSYKVYVYSFTQTGDVAVRNKYEITTSVTDVDKGFIEWLLDGTDLAASFYFYLDLEKSGYNLDVPTDASIYVDVEEKGKSSYVSGTTVPSIKIRTGTWIGKTVKFSFYDINGNAIDMSPFTVRMNYEDQGKTPAYLTASSCTTGGVCTFAVTSGKFAGAAGTIYPICFKITSNGTGAEYILEPARGHVVLEVY